MRDLELMDAVREAWRDIVHPHVLDHVATYLEGIEEAHVGLLASRARLLHARRTWRASEAFRSLQHYWEGGKTDAFVRSLVRGEVGELMVALEQTVQENPAYWRHYALAGTSQDDCVQGLRDTLFSMLEDAFVGGRD